jgi:hypothetical protein
MYISERLLGPSPNQLPRLVACDKFIRPERPKCKRGQEALSLQPSMGRPENFFIEAVRLTQKDSLTLHELDKRSDIRAGIG